MTLMQNVKSIAEFVVEVGAESIEKQAQKQIEREDYFVGIDEDREHVDDNMVPWLDALSETTS
ncbi:hypothetical protein J6590_057584 [Homalodisca vitripennis]|nr:hypothetical protein J6590_057584 [Homalodisca vitripennis]